jgi:asparagine synthase (glutamine-hydrolysing)
MKIANGQRKRVLKKAFERFLPHEILYRPKQGFSVPLAAWFRGAFGTRFMDELAGPDGLQNSPYFNGPKLQQLALEHQSGVRDHSRVLWLLWMFQRFLRDVHVSEEPGAFSDSRRGRAENSELDA